MTRSNAALRLVVEEGEVPRASNDRRGRAPHDEDLYPSAFAAALEAIPTAAFLLSPSGVVIHANGPGRLLLSQEGDSTALANALRLGVRRPSPMFVLTRVPSPDFPDHYLVVLRRTPPDPAQRISAAAQRWGLTQRQHEVLALLARGLTNRAIAVMLDRAEATVEVHVSALLAKFGCETRAELLYLLLAT